MKSLSVGSNFQCVACLPKDSLSKKFQLFEVLVVESLNRLDPTVEWSVTQVSGDSGVDFRGAGPQREFNILNLTIHQTLLGQTKRRASKNVNLFDADLKKIGKIAQSETISGVIFVFSSESLSAEDLYEHFRDADTSIHFRGAKYFVDARRFEDLWAHDREHVLKVLDRCLIDEQKQIIDDYLGSIAHTSQVRLQVEISSESIGRTGKRFRCRLEISQRVPLPKLKVRLRYKPDPLENSKFEVLLPSRLAGPGYELLLSGHDPNKFEFFLRCFVGGKRRLGTITIETEAGLQIDSVDLGEKEFLRTFEPPYFDKPNRNFHRNVTLRLGAAANGEVHPLAILGAGGAGKSRFCDAVLEEAADLGFDWVTTGHDNSIKARRRLLRSLIMNLMPNGEGSPYEQVLHWLRGRVNPLKSSRERALKTYFEDDNEAVAAEVVVATLLAVIVERTKYQPLFIHLRDLHWADGETLSILGDVIDALRNARQLTFGVVFLLEGRDRDSLRLQTGLYRPPEDWLAFLNARGYEQIEIPPWTKAHSKDFLHDLIEAARVPTKGVVSARLPLFEQMCDHIMSASAGNPMHIIEQLKSLIDKEYVAVTDSGTIYLKQFLPVDWQPAQTIEELINSRLAFLRARSPLAAELLIVMAKIGPRVPGALFRFVHRTGGSDVALISELYGMDMAIMPRHDGESFEFRHENYYHVCRNTQIRGNAPYLAAAISFYQNQHNLTAKQDFEAAFLLAHNEPPDYSVMLRHVIRGMDEAKRTGDSLLCLDFYTFFLNLPSNIMNQSGLDPAEVRLDHGVRQILSGNWEKSLKSLREAESIFARRPQVQSRIRRVLCKLEIIDALVTLMRTDEAIEEFEKGQSLIDATLAHSNDLDGSAKRSLIETRDRLWLRCAVTNWFDGNLREAAKWQRRAFVSGRSEHNYLTKGEALREFGTLTLHRNPLFGRRLLLQAIEQLDNEHQHQSTILARVEILFADLLLASWVNSDLSRIRSIKQEANQLHYLCQEKASLYEAALVALVSGSCCALNSELEDAHHWFKLAVTTAMRTSAFEEIWKGRVNLSQICLELGLLEEAKVHATEAVETLLVGLDSGSWNRRAVRRQMLMWPLLQCIRGAPELERRLSRYLCDVDSARKQWKQRPPAISRSKTGSQVLHVRRGDSDFYFHT